MVTPSKPKGNRLVIGIDYGTTFTGVSYCELSANSGMEQRIQIVHNWPSANDKTGTKEKVPSEIAYTPEGIKWGAQIPVHTKRHMWTKLDLDPTPTSESDRIRMEQLEAAIGGPIVLRKPLDIVADFLAQVKAHLIKNLDNQYGPNLWKSLPITLVLTVPAVWSDAAKDRTLQAFSQAGFNKVDLPNLESTITTTEPEAAALYTINSIRGSVRNEQLKKGDGFVICDMGGGTVDLIAYRVSSINPTTIEEATVGTGDQCGGSFVERGFLTWLEKKLGVDDFVKIAGNKAQDLPRIALPAKMGKLIQKFTQDAKSGFSGTEEAWLGLPHPLGQIEEDEQRGISEGEIHLTSDDMIEIFEMPLEKTRKLLSEQIKQAEMNDTKLKYIFMVGGFAESTYVFEKLKQFIQSQGKIQVVRPDYAWSAIVRGATTKGLEECQLQLHKDARQPIQARKCRRHYGTPCRPHFDKRKHREEDAHFSQYTGKKVAKNQVKWSVSKGQHLSTTATVHGIVELSARFWLHQDKKATARLLASDSDSAPKGSRENDVYEVATLKVDLSSVPAQNFHKKRSPSGILYMELDYQVVLSVGSILEYSVKVDNKTYGSVTATYG
ncbi:Hsp70 family protein [Periconia macrospinosa]|uniref:Hsp70 family protein n=1 Tax=Periconia macrospinosa TaxID=97972 RepID=A0A2V1DPZ9_9PLEO|nr:Hsp70 family protein [Periconia macrospinosa]